MAKLISIKNRFFKKRLFFTYGNPCACGCGLPTPVNKKGKMGKYFKDHHHKIRIGTKHSPETINKMKQIKIGESNPLWKPYESLTYWGIHQRMRREIKK